MSVRDYLTIGEVVQRLQTVHPDLSISKVRFLEDEGLITPERTPGGYRKFTLSDVSRIEAVLRLQKEFFLPLAIIKEKLAELDRGRVPAELQRAVVTSESSASFASGLENVVRVEEAPSAFDIPVTFVRELAEFDVIRISQDSGGDYIEPSDIGALHASWDLRKYGIEPRHLRMYETFAEREATLFAQILLPGFRHKTPDSRRKLAETLTELGTLTDELKSGLLRRALARVFEDHT